MEHSKYESYRLEWRELEIEIRYCREWWFGEDDAYRLAHLQIETSCRSPLPITETGYRSHFTSRDLVAEHGGPVAFVEAWLDADAQGKGWKESEARNRQYSLL